MNKRYSKENCQKDLKNRHTTTPKKTKTALKDINSGRDLLGRWESRANALKVEGL